MLELLARGFEFVINGMESFVFLIAKDFERQGVADIVVLFMVGRAISPAAQYARPSALCPVGICASAPGYVLDRCAVCAHTLGDSTNNHLPFLLYIIKFDSVNGKSHFR